MPLWKSGAPRAVTPRARAAMVRRQGYPEKREIARRVSWKDGCVARCRIVAGLISRDVLVRVCEMALLGVGGGERRRSRVSPIKLLIPALDTVRFWKSQARPYSYPTPCRECKPSRRSTRNSSGQTSTSTAASVHGQFPWKSSPSECHEQAHPVS